MSAAIITNEAGLIDIRNGFAASVQDSWRCSAKTLTFSHTPPTPVFIKYQPQFGLGARIQGFSESESQFGEWPHMCAVLHEQLIAT